MALPCFNSFLDTFYPSPGAALPPLPDTPAARCATGAEGKKLVPYNIDKLLTNINLAHWIMDNGSKQGDGLHLNVYAFSPECVDRFINVLTNKFGIKC